MKVVVNRLPQGKQKTMKTDSSIEFLRIITALPLVLVLLAFAVDYRSSRVGQIAIDLAVVAPAQLEVPGERSSSPCF